MCLNPAICFRGGHKVAADKKSELKIHQDGQLPNQIKQCKATKIRPDGKT